MLWSTFYFSLMNVCVKLLGRLPLHETVFFRAVLALLICAWLLKRAGVPFAGNHQGYLLLRGLYGTAGLILYFYTLQAMPLASAVTLQHLSPIFSAILAMYILREKPVIAQWGCFLLAFAGVLVMKGLDTQMAWWDWAAGLMGAVFSALAYNYVRKLKDYDHPLVTVFYFPFTTTLLLGPYSLTHWVWPQGNEWVLLGILGLVTQQAQLYMTKAYQHEKLANVTAVNYLGLFYALVFGLLLFGETAEWATVFGMSLIVAGVLLNTWISQIKRGEPTIVKSE